MPLPSWRDGARCAQVLWPLSGERFGGSADASSCTIAPARALMIMELRQQRLLRPQNTRQVGVSASTVSQVLAYARRSRLIDLHPDLPHIYIR